MTDALPESGQTTALVLVGLALLAVPTGLALAQNLTTASAGAPPTPAPPPTPQQPANDVNSRSQSQTLVVDIETVADRATAGEDCPAARYASIETAIDDAEVGDVVQVCAGNYTANVTLAEGLLATPSATNLEGTQTASASDTAITPTLPPVNLTATPTPTPSSDNDENNTDDDTNDTDSEGNTGQTLFVNAGGGVGDGVLSQSESSCANPDYPTIQRAVDDATRGDTVRVCGGAYAESVTVETGDLTVRTNGGAVVEAGPLVAFNIKASGVTIDGFVVRTTNGAGIWVSGERAVLRDNTISSSAPDRNDTEHDDGIKLVSTNRSVVRNNTVVGFPNDGISVGDNDITTNSEVGTLTNESTFTLIVGNTLTESGGNYGSRGSGIHAGTGAHKTVIRNNTITENEGNGITVHGNAKVIGNTLRRNNPGNGMVTGAKSDVDVIGNTLRNVGNGIEAHGRSNIINNDIRHVVFTGMFFQNVSGGHSTQSKQRDFHRGERASGRALENRISDSAYGLTVNRGNTNFSRTVVRRNVFLGNSYIGIWNVNGNKTDGYWPIFNATNNVWSCGGPSSGGGGPNLKDPYTGKKANGTGDTISSGDEALVSNVHFDPFLEVETCPSSQSNPDPTATPTPTPTATPTPTPTATPTPTPTPTPTAPPGIGNGTGGTAGNGTGGTGAGERGVSGGGGETTVSSPSLSTATPTTSPSPTISPTPRVEPGFGVVAWILGGGVVVLLLAIRRRLSLGID